jgi:hypothetical protein
MFDDVWSRLAQGGEAGCVPADGATLAVHRDGRADTGRSRHSGIGGAIAALIWRFARLYSKTSPSKGEDRAPGLILTG